MQHKLAIAKVDLIHRLNVFYHYLNQSNNKYKQLLELLWDDDEEIRDWCCGRIVNLSGTQNTLAMIEEGELVVVFERAAKSSAMQICAAMLEENPQLYLLLEQCRKRDLQRFVSILNCIKESDLASTEKKKIINGIFLRPLEQYYLQDKIAFNKDMQAVIANEDIPMEIRNLYLSARRNIIRKFSTYSVNLFQVQPLPPQPSSSVGTCLRHGRQSEE